MCASAPCVCVCVCAWHVGCAWACLDLRIFILHCPSSAVPRVAVDLPRPSPCIQASSRARQANECPINATLSNRFVKWPRGLTVVKRRYAADAASRRRPPLCRSKRWAAGPWRASAGLEWCMRMLRWDDGALATCGPGQSAGLGWVCVCVCSWDSPSAWIGGPRVATRQPMQEGKNW